MDVDELKAEEAPTTGTTPTDFKQASAPLLAYRRLMVLGLLLPMLALPAVLGWMQYRAQRHGFLVETQGLLEARLNEVDGMTAAAVEHVSNMRHWMQGDLAMAPPSYPAKLQSLLSPRHVDGQIDGYSLDQIDDQARDYLGQFLWVAPQPPTSADLNRFAYFSGPASMAHALKPFFAWSYYFSSAADLIIIYPWTPARTVVEDQGHRSMRKALAGWLDYDVYKQAVPAANPRRDAYWVDPYIDAGGKGLMVSHAAPVYDAKGRFSGMVGTDLLLSTLQEQAEAWHEDRGRWWISTASGILLADSRQTLLTSAKEQQPPSLASRLPRGLTKADVDAVAYVISAPRETGRGVLFGRKSRNAPWSLIYFVPESEIRAALLPGMMPYAQMSLLILLVFMAGLFLVQGKIVGPALAVLDYLMSRISRKRASEPKLNKLWRPVMQAVLHNFDAQQRIERQQRRSEALKSAVVDNALFAIVTTDEEGRIVEFNPNAEQTFGMTREQALGQKVSNIIVPPRYRQAHLDGMARMKMGSPHRVIGQRVELEALRADGTEIPVEMVLARSEIDGEVFYSALLTDLSERRRVAAEVERQREALRHSERISAMGSLLAGVAHELNNPLAILMGRASMLEQKCEDPAVLSDAQRIREAAERCGRIVRTFLNMARNERGERKPVQLNDMVRGAVDLLAYSLRTNGIEVSLRLQHDLPEVCADGDQIGQVVLNLLVNAQQAAGVRRVSVATGVDEDGQGRLRGVWLRLQDDGQGVPPELAQRVFDPFFTTKPAGTGTGLGLSVSRGIVKDHGGELVLEPMQAGQGASFLMRLPAQAAQSVVEAPLPAVQTDGDADDSVVHSSAFLARILVVDDEPELTDLMRAMLEGQGYEVMSAESAEIGLAFLAEAAFDLVLSDLRMPGMDGPAFWRELVKLHPGLARRVVFVTGDTLSVGAREFLKETGCACVEKPFTQAELLAKVQMGLQS
jgi:two-component system NtrC family sensor kinase